MLASDEKNNKANKQLIDASLFNDNIPKKILLAFFPFSSEYCIIPNEPLVKLISKFPEIEQILKIDKSEIIHYLYFSYNKIHNILYEEEKEIQINYDEKNSTSYYFYLSLLIMAKIEIVNYKYNFEYVREVFNKVKSINENHKYKIVIMSELLSVLINNFKGIIGDVDEDEDEDGDEDEDEDENKKNEEQNELKKIEDENNKIFADNINIFEQININFVEIKSKTIDEIYIIIIALIKLKKFEDYKYTYNIIEQLDIENIAITQLMYDELLKILDEDVDYINDYKITKKEDLFNEKKINFFYILIKYVLKSPIYIYRITLLFNLKKFVMKLLNSNKISVKEIKNNKLQYLIWTLMDSEYYFSKIPESDYNKLKEILTYYKNFCFESKKEEIAILTNLLENNWGKYKKYLNEYDKAQKMNERYTIIKYLFENSNNKENKIKKRTEELLKNEANNWLKIEDLIKSEKFNKINQDFAHILLKFLNENKNKEIIHKFFSKEIIKNFIKQFTTYKKKDSNLEKSIMKEEKINSIKLKLSFLNSIRKPIEDDNRDPTYNLLSNYSELKSILEMNHPQTARFLYINIEKVLEILYESNNKVFFEFKESKRSLSFYFYLNILLSEKFDIPRFKFKQEYIKELQDLQIKNDKLSFARLIRGKHIIDLIDISNTSKLRFKAENKKIYDYNINIINKEIYSLNRIGIFWKSDYIIEKKIDEIYLEIIISLIKNKKFDEYEKIEKAMEELEFENIGLTQSMYEEIAKVLYNNKILNEYKITNEKDLSSEKKINFYMIFFKYIFKDSYKVYHLELFRDTRKTIKEIIQKKGTEIFFKNKSLDKIKYILKCFNLPYESMEVRPIQRRINTNYFDSDRNILGFFGYNSSNYIAQNSYNNNSYVNSQELSYNNDSFLSSSSFGNQLIQENDKSKEKNESKNIKEIIINESKVEEVKEYFKNKNKTKSQNQNEFSQLNILKNINNFLTEISRKENKKILESFQENLLNSNVGGILELFSIKDNAKKVEILKEIILNSKFQKLISDKDLSVITLDKIIDEVFYFTEPIFDISDLEKNISENSTIQINSNSITNFNEWINNYKLPSK